MMSDLEGRRMNPACGGCGCACADVTLPATIWRGTEQQRREAQQPFVPSVPC